MPYAARQDKRLQMIGAFVFGVVFLVVVLTLTFMSERLTPFQQWIIIVVLSLAAGGVAAILPGFIVVDIPLPAVLKRLVRAGGALAVFALVLYLSAPRNVIDDEIYDPKIPAEPRLDAWFKGIDAKDFTAAYRESASELFRNQFSQVQFENYVRPIREKLGASVSRVINGGAPMISPPGMPKGLYRQYVSELRFSGLDAPVFCSVVLIGERESQDWRVYGFTYAVYNSQGVLVPYVP